MINGNTVDGNNRLASNFVCFRQNFDNVEKKLSFTSTE